MAFALKLTITLNDDYGAGLMGELVTDAMRGTLLRTLMWFCSVLSAAAVFSLALSAPAFLLIFRFTLIFAAAPAVLFAPYAISSRDARVGKVGGIVLWGTLIGPAFLLLWGVVAQVAGRTVNWEGDVAPGMLACLVYALMVGLMASGMYALLLKGLRAAGL